MKKEAKRTAQSAEKPNIGEKAKTPKKQLQGIVVSDKMKDTAVVLVQSFFKHPRYKKYISRSKKFMAHDAGNVKKIGDKATIEETAPISRRKRFKIIA